jgi:polypeptide N-acetylgalactosaminyltransferase
MMAAKIVCIRNFSINIISFSLAPLKEQLETYIKRWNGLVKLYRTGKRVGLIAARTLGAEKATGDVIVILDAHCECVCLREK